jgi:hypothetical protein
MRAKPKRCSGLPDRRRHCALIATLVLVPSASTAALRVRRRSVFEPQFDGVHPLLVIAAVSLAADATLGYLRVRAGFLSYSPGACSTGCVPFAAGVSPLFGAMSIALVAGIIFHALPRALLLAVTRAASARPTSPARP